MSAGRKSAARIAVFALANLLALLALLVFADEARGQGEVHAAPSATVSSAAPVFQWSDLDLQTRLKDLDQVDVPGRGRCYVLKKDGAKVYLTPDELAELQWQARTELDHASFAYKLFNITTPYGFLWVSVGFLGQALFTFRMLLQWWASEKEKRSVVPVGFWWGSLFGGLMLFAYFAWRKDVVGVLGQSTGVFVYARNLVLIYRARALEAHASTRPHTA